MPLMKVKQSRAPEDPYSLSFKNLLQIYHFDIKTLEEATQLSPFIASFFPEEKTVCIEMGLNELLFNAIEHGNLNISYDEKTELQKNNTWYEEVQNRLNNPANINKVVSITMEINPTFSTIVIEDQGSGFDWQECTLDAPSSLGHGRGLLLAQSLSFDRIEFLGRGNKVRCTIYH